MRPGRAFGASRGTRGALALAVGALLVLPGCGSGGGGKPIPPGDAARLLGLVQTADNLNQQGRCTPASNAAHAAGTVAARLPHSVSSSVRNGIADGIARLQDLIGTQCQQPRTQTNTTPTQSQTTSTTTTTPSTTTPTTTTPSTTTPTTTTPTTTTGTTTTGTTTTGTSTGNGGAPTSTGGVGQ